MLPSCNMMLFLLVWVTAYGNTLTISSTVNSTEFVSDPFTGLTINSSCETAYQCRGKLVCTDGQCRCSENYIWNGTSCIEEKIANDTCTNTMECGGKLICEDGVCQCLLNLFWNGNKCTFKHFEGLPCESSVECAENLECKESFCRCSKSKYWEISKCYSKKSINDACVKEEECSATLHCDRRVCQCASSNYWTGSLCSIKKDENSFCNSSMECKASLQCLNNHCSCCDQDYWNGQFCERKRNMTNQCQESVQCQDTLHCIRGTCQDSCAVVQCMNGGNCQISGNRHRCECCDGYLGDKCQYADGREKNFIVIFNEAYSTPSPRILPTVSRMVQLSIFYFENNKNMTVTLNSADNHCILDSSVRMTNGLQLAGAEIHSNVPITLYGFLFLRMYSEGFFVLPTRYSSTEYLIPSFTPYITDRRSVFSLSSVYSTTVVRIHFKIKDGAITYDNMQFSNNQTLTLVINKYTAFQISHITDLTGTRIIASQPIIVVSGNVYNQVIGGSNVKPFIEMVLPTNQLDNVYVIPYLKYRPANTVRVLAVNNTNIALNNGNNRTRNTLKSRDFMDYFHTTISYVSSADDVMVHIFPHELSSYHGDAFMMTIPGINQYLYDYDFMVPIDFESFISITVPTDAVHGFVLDGYFVNLKNVFSISEGEHRFSSFSIPISSGSHHITQSKKTRFGLWIFGNHTNYDAYGYHAGMAFKT